MRPRLFAHRQRGKRMMVMIAMLLLACPVFGLSVAAGMAARPPHSWSAATHKPASAKVQASDQPFHGDVQPATQHARALAQQGGFADVKLPLSSTASGHVCARLDASLLKCWGDNAYGQLGLGDSSKRGDQPGQMGNHLPAVDLGSNSTVLQVTTGNVHTCALLDNGSISCWGGNEYGQLGLGTNISRYGTQPGQMGDQLPNVKLGTNYTARQVAAGAFHTCTLLRDGSVKCWGRNRVGALGLGDTTNRGDQQRQMGDRLPAVDLGTGRTARWVAAGRGFTCAVLDDGSVKCWGYNDAGQLGLGDSTNRGAKPGQMGDQLPTVALGSNRTAVRVAAGSKHTCALLDDGSIKCWGDNSHGQLGLGDSINRGDKPGQMGDHLPAMDLRSNSTVMHVTAGSNHTCALLVGGTVKCWGDNTFGQLGLGDTSSHGDKPGQMGGHLPAVDLGTGRRATWLVAAKASTCAELDDGAIKCWGSNTLGQLGLATNSTVANMGGQQGQMGDHLPAVELISPSLQRPPVLVPAAGVTDVRLPWTSIGSSHMCALLSAGLLKCWGANGYGQLGLGDSTNRADQPGEMGDQLPAVDLGTGRTALQVTAGYTHTCALLDDGSIKCWGDNEYGKLGLGTNSSSYGEQRGQMGDQLPTIKLGTNRTAVQVAAGLDHTCALLDDGSIKCWGANDNGQLGLGDTHSRGNKPGQMGDQLPAVDLGTGRTARWVAAGWAFMCVVLDDGSVRCWGDSAGGELGLGDTTDRGDKPGQMGDQLPTVALGTNRTTVRVAVGGGHACALLDDGSVKCWGLNDAGQLGLGDSTSRGDKPGQMGDHLPAVDLGSNNTVLHVTAGDNHTCALLGGGTVKCWGDNRYGQLGLGDTINRGDKRGQMGEHLPAVALGTGRTATWLVAAEASTCVELDDGTIKCWGDNQYGQLGLASSSAVDDTWGGQQGQMGDHLPTVELFSRPLQHPPVLSPTTGCFITKLASSISAQHTCALLDGGSVKCWGHNDFGQLGLGDTNNRGDQPGQMADQLPVVALGTGRTAQQLALGRSHTCALLSGGEVKCWGNNWDGQLGLGTNISSYGNQTGQMGDQLPTVKLGTSRTVRQVAAGAYHTCALLDDGGVKCWGDNSYGQLGLGDSTDRGDKPGQMGNHLPAVDLGTGRTAQQLTAGAQHTCALLDNGSIKCWGDNSIGQLGLGNNISSYGTQPGQMGDKLPTVKLGTSHTVRQVAAGGRGMGWQDAGGSYTCALLDDGSVKCWGSNDYGQLGLGDRTNRGDDPGQMGDHLPAVDLGTGRTVLQLAAGSYHVCALLDNGSVKCWGDNAAGQLGLPDMYTRSYTCLACMPGETGDFLPAVSLGADRTVLQVVAGYTHTCVLLTSGTAICWGDNYHGQLGLGNRQPVPPDLMSSLPPIKVCSTNASHSPSVPSPSGPAAPPASQLASPAPSPSDASLQPAGRPVSTAAIIGIAAGGSVVFALVIAAVVVLLGKHRNRHMHVKSVAAQNTSCGPAGLQAGVSRAAGLQAGV